MKVAGKGVVNLSAYREFTFGETVCRIYVNKRVDPLADHILSVATAFADGRSIMCSRC